MTAAPTTASQPKPVLRTAVDPQTQAARRSALVAGVGLLLMAALAVVAFVGVVDRLITEGDAARTAADLVASATQFRLATAALLVVALLDVVVAWALLRFFAPVNRDLATLAAWLRLAYAGVFVVAIGQLTGVSAVVDGGSFVDASLDARGAYALSQYGSFDAVWQAGLALFGAHLVLVGYLAFASGYVPRALGVLVALAGFGYLVDAFGSLAVPNYSLSVTSVTFIGEVLLMVWLLVRGRRVVLPADSPPSD